MSSQSVKIFILVVGLMQVVFFVVHYVFYKFGVNTFPFLEKNKNIFGIILFVLSISFAGSMMLVQKFPNIVTENFYSLGAIWLGTIFWIFLAIMISILARYILPTTSDIHMIISLVFIAIAFAISAYGVYHGYSGVVVKRDIGISTLPDAWQGRRAIFVADTHYGHIHGMSKARKDLAFIESLNPDMLFIAGDFFDGPSRNLHAFADVYKDFNPKYGKYFVSGNHEEYAGMSDSLVALREAGFIILDDQNINIDGVQLLGVPYTTNAKSDIDAGATTRLLSGFMYDRALPSILLKHIPINTDIIKDAGVSFAFFGHTHRGQSWPMNLIVKKVYGKHGYGFVEEDNTLFYTTSGLGSWGPPQRIGSDSELLLATFNKK